jgi:outer membrane immunogenic protein
MKHLVIGSLAVVALAVGSAQAADLPVKARTQYTPAPVAFWTGGYIGANVGYSWGRSRSDGAFTNAVGGPLSTGANRFDMNGVIGGGQIGYNWQQSNWVWGLEADIQGSGEKGSRAVSCGLGICSSPFGVGPAIGGSFSEKLDWFGTVRARAGVLVAPTVLAYATGGLAYGSIKSDLSLAIPSTANAFSHSSTRVGWTVGGGVESKLGGNWSAKLEYLYMDLGSDSNSYTTTFPALGGGVVGFNANSRFTDNILRAGLNYKFN